ncbi:PH domain-containing protein [Methylobacterium nonmethylotrophicum]|uniref:PH domain-containing protein n=1 Tax=Methylobacterium nonmethylotrophicum TaxID=1141884 RepID=A0A4Z0P020_9HYPH|nr:PH domain-containing protein [Methylobacterium nonmethylotrophicum]TGE02622.1 PH domain-containing protein [Methylobacterium nonmethylotrophicum]
MGLLDGLLGHGSDATPESVAQDLDGMLVPGETVQLAFRMIRDLMVFTDRRLILVDKQGVTGRKVSYLTVPYRAITSFSIENAGSFDLDSELTIWISGRPDPIARTLKRGADIRGIQRAIAATLR